MQTVTGRLVKRFSVHNWKVRIGPRFQGEEVAVSREDCEVAFCYISTVHDNPVGDCSDTPFLSLFSRAGKTSLVPGGA